jgi:hypothetical protein
MSTKPTWHDGKLNSLFFNGSVQSRPYYGFSRGEFTRAAGD